MADEMPTSRILGVRGLCRDMGKFTSGDLAFLIQQSLQNITCFLTRLELHFKANFRDENYTASEVNYTLAINA
jgi:hypothetical protein